LRNFSHKGVPFKDSFQVENGKVIHVAETFTITKKSTALLVDDEKVYPPFCYKNYAEYAVMKAAQPIGTYPTAEMLTFLKEDGVKEADKSTIVLSTLTNLYSSIRLTANRNGFDYAYAYRIQITSSRM
jgi:hypothetical protein